MCLEITRVGTAAKWEPCCEHVSMCLKLNLVKKRDLYRRNEANPFVGLYKDQSGALSQDPAR